MKVEELRCEIDWHNMNYILNFDPPGMFYRMALDWPISPSKFFARACADDEAAESSTTGYSAGGLPTENRAAWYRTDDEAAGARAAGEGREDNLNELAGTA